jgi:cobalt-zinc-cadmium efflux system protein
MTIASENEEKQRVVDTEHKHENSSEQLSGSKLVWVTLLNAAITVIEIIGGLLSGSLSLFSDAVHNLSDTLSIVLSYAAWKIAGRKKNSRKTYGYKRAEILAAFINATSLIVISVFLIFEAVKRLMHPEQIHGTLMIAVAAFGLAANLISVFLLEKDSHGNLNIRSSFLHLMGDTISSVAIVFGGFAIKYMGWNWIDPVATAAIALYIGYESFKIVKRTVDILMQSSADLDYHAMQNDIESFPEVKGVHHVHTWHANENTIFMEAHIDVEDTLVSKVNDLIERIGHLLHEKYDISHVTLQFEADRCEEKTFFKV